MSDAAEVSAAAVPIRLVPPAELDVATAAPFASEVADALRMRPDAVLIDCSGLRFCDSTGLRALLNAMKHGRALDVDIRVVHPSRPLLRLADLVGVSDLLRLTSLGRP